MFVSGLTESSGWIRPCQGGSVDWGDFLNFFFSWKLVAIKEMIETIHLTMLKAEAKENFCEKILMSTVGSFNNNVQEQAAKCPNAELARQWVLDGVEIEKSRLFTRIFLVDFILVNKKIENNIVLNI